LCHIDKIVTMAAGAGSTDGKQEPNLSLAEDDGRPWAGDIEKNVREIEPIALATRFKNRDRLKSNKMKGKAMPEGVITEADTCREFVTPRLVEAGWGTAPHTIGEQKARAARPKATACTGPFTTWTSRTPTPRPDWSTPSRKT
jgi:hypothetical protein